MPMHIDWAAFTPWASLAGGVVIGLATAVYLLGAGRIAGISGIVGGVLGALRGTAPWRAQGPRLLFIAGLVLAPFAWRLVAPLPAARIGVGAGWIVAAGLLVGFGTRMANGCTSGHGVCGLSRLSLRSLVNVLAFMGAGVATVLLLRGVLGV
jgi:uncharacterized membrane protein YedE/YeeE